MQFTLESFRKSSSKFKSLATVIPHAFKKPTFRKQISSVLFENLCYSIGKLPRSRQFQIKCLRSEMRLNKYGSRLAQNTTSKYFYLKNVNVPATPNTNNYCSKSVKPHSPVKVRTSNTAQVEAQTPSRGLTKQRIRAKVTIDS